MGFSISLLKFMLCNAIMTATIPKYAEYLILLKIRPKLYNIDIAITAKDITSKIITEIPPA